MNWRSCQDRIGSHCQKGLSRGIIRYVVLTFWMDGSSTLQSRVIVRPFGLHHLRPSTSSALTGRIPLQEQPLFSSFIIKRLVWWMTMFHWNAEMICPFKEMQWHLEQSWQLRFICTVVNNYAIWSSSENADSLFLFVFVTFEEFMLCWGGLLRKWCLWPSNDIPWFSCIIMGPTRRGIFLQQMLWAFSSTTHKYIHTYIYVWPIG